jgi:hypothetical protein
MTYKGYDESKPKPQRGENKNSDINENTSASSSRSSSTSSSAPQSGGGSEPCCGGDTEVLSVEVGNVLSENEILNNVLSDNELLNKNTILSDLIGGDVLSEVSIGDILDDGIANDLGGVLNDLSVSEVIEHTKLDTDILNDIVDIGIKDVLEVDLEDIEVGGIANGVLGGGVLSDIDIKENVFGAAVGILNVNGDVLSGLVEAEDVKLAVVKITDNVTKLDVLSDVVETGDILKGVLLSDVLEVEDIENEVSLVDDVVAKAEALNSNLDDMNATLEAPVEIATDVLDDGTSIIAGTVEQVTATLEAPVKIVAEVLSGDTIASVLSGNKLVADALNGKFVSTILDGKVIAEVLGGDADLSKIGIEVIDVDLSEIVSDTGDVHAIIAAVDPIADLGGLDQLIASVDLFDIGDLLPDLADHHG